VAVIQGPVYTPAPPAGVTQTPAPRGTTAQMAPQTRQRRSFSGRLAGA
jgi:hypothetical protein